MAVKRPLFLSALALVSLTAGACATVDPDAATVNGTHIKMRDFERVVKASIASSSDPAAKSGADTGKFQSTYAAQILALQVIGTVLDQEASKQGFTPSSAGAQRADRIAPQLLGLTTPEDFAKAPVDRRAKATKWAYAYVALDEKLALPPFDDTKLKGLYAIMVAGGKLGDVVCASHILVATEDEAKALKADIAKGKSFEDAAKAQSIDKGSGANGGTLRGSAGECIAADGLVPEFVEGARASAVGVISDPVKSEFGYHLIRNDKAVGPPSYEDATAQVQTASDEARREPFTAYFKSLVETANVKIDPRYGTWVPETGDINPPASQ